MNKIVLFLLAALMFTACRKNRNLKTAVYGRVITQGTYNKASSKQLKINLYRISDKSGLFGFGETLVEEGMTDTNGFYSFSFKAENDYSAHWIRLEEVQVENHFSIYPVTHRIEVGEHQVLNIELLSHAWVRLHVENINPQPLDRLTVNWGGSTGGVKSFHGQANEEVIFMGGGNVNRSFAVELFRNGIRTNWRDTVWMLPFDTTYHKIEY
jgi:hypothetical protein